jgi:hypothetical protein
MLVATGGPMNYFKKAILMAVCVGAVFPAALQAQQPAAPGGAAIRACALATKADVKKHLPWAAMLDNMPIEEEPIGSSGSSCNYPSVTIQVLPLSQPTLDAVRKKDDTEAVEGIGDEAYFHENPNGYGELYVKVGRNLLTLQASAEGDIRAVKPGVVSLAKELVAKLR